MHAFSEQMVKPLIKKIWKGNERSSNSLFEPQRIVLNLKESSTPDRHLHRHLYLRRPGGDTKPVHVTGDMEKYLTTEGTKNGLEGFNKHDLIAATTMKGAPIHYLNPQNCLEFEGNLNARSASAISSARIPSESYADFFYEP